MQNFAALDLETTLSLQLKHWQHNISLRHENTSSTQRVKSCRRWQETPKYKQEVKICCVNFVLFVSAVNKMCDKYKSLTRRVFAKYDKN